MGKSDYNRKLNKCLVRHFAILFFFSFIIQLNSFSQARDFADRKPPPPPPKDRKFDPDRMRYGGSFGATFGQITYVEVSPTVGYMLTDRLLSGIGGKYIYYEENLDFFDYKTNIYGGSIFSQYFILDNVLAHTELEVLNLDDRFIIGERVNVTSFFVGGGYVSEIGDRSFGSILVLFNLTEDINTPYTNPVIRINFGFGI
tara:strand:- start:12563 stop:13162 length:600 start_codon:yes stop_codon:yes gene_type:complete